MIHLNLSVTTQKGQCHLVRALLKVADQVEYHLC